MKQTTSLYIISICLLIACTPNKSNEPNENTNPFYYQAHDFRTEGKSDSAFIFFNKAKELFIEQKDTLGTGKCMVNMAIILEEKGDYFNSQEVSLSAIPFFDPKNEEQRVYLKSNYNSLGLATYKLEDYKNALKFYDLAIQFAVDSSDIFTFLNNKAKVYHELKMYPEAINLYNKVLKGSFKNQKIYARALTNLAIVKWQQNPNYPAAADLIKALKIREHANDIWGQNSSYAHLSDYYTKKNPDSALLFAHKMYEVANDLKSPADRLQALYKLVVLSSPNSTKQYFKIYEHLDDSLKVVRRNEKNQFAIIHYETEKHKADFLKAQAENIKKENNILRKNIWLALLGLCLVAGYFWYRKRRRDLEKDKELEVKNTEIKYVKKVHDRVANKIYQVMSEVENTPTLNKEEIADKLEIIYNISRDLSYEIEDARNKKTFVQDISTMIHSYASSSISITLNGSDEKIWDQVNDLSKTEIYYILQELMVNMKKHSKATKVIISMERNKNLINIFYSDNGIGIGKNNFKNGLTSTGNRINIIQGTIIFDTKDEIGLNIQISFPISK